jgi:Uma2 family endonuclease
MVTAVRKLTASDFWKFPDDDGNRHELIDGEWYMTPPPNSDHQAVVTQLAYMLLRHVMSRKLGRVLVAPLAVVLGRHSVPEPDIVFIAESRRAILKKKGVYGAPDLVVEVLSPSTESYDRGKKASMYEEAGVREYWLADPEERTIEIREFRRVRRVRIYREGQSFESALFPGLRLRVDEIFESIP